MKCIIILLLLLVLLFLILFIGKKHDYDNEIRYRQWEKQQQREVNTRRRITPARRQQILERDEYTCQICGISKEFMDELCEGLGDYLRLEIDHIVPVAEGGTRDDDNLQVLCWRCNAKKTSRYTNDEVYDMIDYGIDYLEEY